MLAFQHAQLLTEGGQFKGEVMPRAKKCTGPMKNSQKELKHSIILREQKALIDENESRAILLISRPDMVLATDNVKSEKFTRKSRRRARRPKGRTS